MADPIAIETTIERLGHQLDSLYLGARFAHFPASIGKSRGPLRLLIPTSNYAFGTWEPHEDIHLVCLSEDRPETFWLIVGEAVLEQEAKLAVPRDCHLDLTDHLRLHEALGDGRLILHHCRMPETFDLQLMQEYGVPLYTESLPRSERIRLERDISSAQLQATIRKLGEDLQHRTAEGEALGMVQDITQLLGRFGRHDLEIWPNHHTTFCNALLCVRTWATNSGILHRSFSYMTADTLLWLVYNDHSQYHTPDPALDEDEVSSAARTRQYLYQFFSRCCRFAFETERDTMRLKLTTPSGRTPANYMSPLGVEALWNGMQRLRSFDEVQVPRKYKHIDTLMNSDGAGRFADDGDIFVKVYVECLDPQKRDHLREKTLPALLPSLAYMLKRGVDVQLWPSPVEDDHTTGTSTYVLAVHWLPGSISTARQLSNTTAAWLGKADYDRTEVVLRIVFARSSDIKELMVPSKPDPSPADASADDVAMQEASQAPDDEKHAASSSKPLRRRPVCPLGTFLEEEYSIIPPLGFAELPSDDNKSMLPRKDCPPGKERFQTATQAISKLRWDQKHRYIPYEIGYMDRFAGLQWMDLEQWGGKASEDEDFIPAHRVRILRRKWDRIVVWDREGRVDDL